MQHLSEQDLVLYHYGEIDRKAVDEHLAGCETCLREYDQLRDVLGTLDAMPVPRRSEDYPQQVWQLLSARLPEQRTTWWSSWLSVPRLRLAAAVVALVIVAFMLGRFARQDAGLPSGPIAETVRERILLIAVGDHLERSQRLLIELVHAEGNGEIDISAEQRKAERLAASNRLYRRSATRSGDPLVVDILDELERTLLEVANGPSSLGSSRLEDLRRRIERRGLLFKIRVIGDKVRQDGAARGPADQV
jgi:hypothetical protein